MRNETPLVVTLAKRLASLVRLGVALTPTKRNEPNTRLNRQWEAICGGGGRLDHAVPPRATHAVSHPLVLERDEKRAKAKLGLSTRWSYACPGTSDTQAFANVSEPQYMSKERLYYIDLFP